MAERVRVTSADFIRSIGYWQSEALRHPVVITHHGRERLVLAAPENFNQPSSADAGAASELATLKSVHEALLDNLDEGFLLFDADLNVVHANRVALEFCGRDLDSINGAPLAELMPQPLGALLLDRAQRVMRARKHEGVQAATFDGRHLAANVFPLGASIAVLFHNVTETAALRRRLEEDDALAAALRRHSRAAAIKLDARARIESVGASFCVMSGFAGGDLVGHRFIDLVGPQYRRDTGELIERVLRERASGELGLTMLGRRGDEHHGRLAAAPILSDFVAQGVMAVWAPSAANDSMESAA